MTLDSALTLAALRKLASEKTFQRGLTYFHEGSVGLIESHGNAIQAHVRGTHRYRVSLSTDERGDLIYACTCPVGSDGSFCKHAVALGVFWLENSGEEVFPLAEPEKPRKKRKTQADTIREYLATLGENELREALLDAADWDRRLRDKLVFAAKASAGSDILSLRAAVRQATRTAGFLDWREAASYATRLEQLARLLEKRIGDGNPRLVELIEEAIKLAESALEHIDDSNGGVYPAIEELQEIHLQACIRLHPDPTTLAERLFRYQMEGQWDTFLNILPQYENALGHEGLARYRELLENKWQTLPALTPADARTRGWDGQRYRMEHAMQALAAQSGDVDALAAIKAQDLSSPRRFLALAELYAQHQRWDKALYWAEQGFTAFPHERNHDLRDFLIEEYLRRGDLARVEVLAWQGFEKQVGFDAYRKLLSTATRIGQRDQLRKKALEFLWTKVADEEAKSAVAKRSYWVPAARSVLVEIHLHEEDGEQMWATLKGGPTDVRLWERAATLRGKTHPEEAITLYYKLLPEKIEVGSRNARYEEAASIVRNIGKLREAQGKADEFRQELARIRIEYKAKRNFIRELASLD